MVSRFNTRLLAIAAVLMFTAPTLALAGGGPETTSTAPAKHKKHKKAKKVVEAPAEKVMMKKNWATKHVIQSQSGPSPVVLE